MKPLSVFRENGEYMPLVNLNDFNIYIFGEREIQFQQDALCSDDIVQMWVMIVGSKLV